MTYLQALEYLKSLINYERSVSYPLNKVFKLERVRRLLSCLGNPHYSLRVIHIAGTKGKGSTCVFTANILKAAGFKTGLYTSPHLLDVRERIRVLCGNMSDAREDLVSKDDFARLVQRIIPCVEELKSADIGRMTYYEVLTVLSLLYFKEQGCGFVVLETGVGGRLDATNVVPSIVCAITPISYEHTRILGRKLSEIAAEKAGIIKKTSLQDGFPAVITAPQRPAALKTIRSFAKAAGARIYEVGKDILIEKKNSTLTGSVFDLRGVFNNYYGLEIYLSGEHQMENAAVAVGCIEALRHYGVEISGEKIIAGLENSRWPGRFHLFSRDPLIVLDVAHNRASAGVLKKSILQFFKFNRLILVFAVLKDKDVKGILKEILPLADQVILTKVDNPRCLEPEKIKSFIIGEKKKDVILTENSCQAMETAVRNTGPEDAVLVCGSVYLVAEVLQGQKHAQVK